MKYVYFILGTKNVALWDSEDPQVCEDIDTDQVHKRVFHNEREANAFKSGLNTLGAECGFKNYSFIDEDEYKFLTS